MKRTRRSRGVAALAMLMLSAAYSMAMSTDAAASSTLAGRLVAVSDYQVWTRESTQIGGNWTRIGPAYFGELNAVRSMAYADGSLWATTTFNRLVVRDAVATDAPWTDVGHANDVEAVTAIGDWLYAVTGDNVLWVRPAQRSEVNWSPVRHLTVDVVAITAWQGGLMAATANNRLVRIDPISGITIADVGTSAKDATTLTAVGGRLYATTSLQRLVTYDAVYDVWYDIGHANSVVAMTTVDV